MTDQQETQRLSKAESARINGAKSQGAVTEQGRQNSANGNLKHGAYSKRVLMDGENAEFYERFKLTFFEHFQPAGPFEFECVESMVVARWRIRRLESTETCQLDTALLSNKPANDAKFDALDILHERAIAVESKIASLDALTRVQERLDRIYERNFKLLVNSRKKSGRTIPESLPHINKAETEVPQTSAPAPNLTDQPTETQPAGAQTDSIITQVALFVVIIALLLLSPVNTTAKDVAAATGPSSLHASPLLKSALYPAPAKVGCQE